MTIEKEYHKKVIIRFHQLKAEGLDHTVQFVYNVFPEYRDLGLDGLRNEVKEIIK